mgnify:CR=1 FL=1
MFSNFLDEENQKKIKNILSSVFLPIKLYCLLIIINLLIIIYYMHLIQSKM